jgi:hypothetical protein
MPVARISVKAGDPFAKSGTPLYYFHSKTKLYTNILFHFWDSVMGPTFAIDILVWIVLAIFKFVNQALYDYAAIFVR